MAPDQPILPRTNSAPAVTATDSKPRGANRSTKVAGKLKVLPDQPDPLTQSTILGEAPKAPRTPAPAEYLTDGTVAGSDEDEDADDEEATEEPEELDVEVYNQIAQIPEGTARRDAIRLTKKKAKSLPRVTAYATASSYRLPELMRFFQARKTSYHTNARLLDDVIYTTYAYEPSSSSASETRGSKHKASESASKVGDLLGVPELRNTEHGDTDAEEHDGPRPPTGNKEKKKKHFDAGVGETAEIFMFEYGTVVIWGMTESQEKRFLSSIRRFEVEKLSSDDVEMEDLNYYYANYSRIYNDVITLRRGSSHMTKLSLSHALSQSVKISLFEELISTTIEDTKDIPEIISETGKIGMPHKEIMQQIGELFLLRININLVGSVLDSPEVFWSYPDLQPLYEAARSYLEIPQRVNLLNTRVEVLQDMLQLLKESVSSRHSERLEQIVIALIGVEIVLGIVTILVDLFS
ncbi:DUF155-domain-containing protein [Rickenella mellea]|uniref:DUF155-domain-containing protein n=1 Tax=Rickenella mellea TaxID=50990 RepID=A0A4Y7QC38_9AGAM|nr:DUF155-domain-containing protein [Rickenella mellea]